MAPCKERIELLEKIKWHWMHLVCTSDYRLHLKAVEKWKRAHALIEKEKQR